MLKELIESSFYVTFPPKDNLVIQVDESQHSGRFSLRDPLACEQCERCQQDSKEQVNLWVSSENTVFSVRVSQIFDRVNNNLGEVCDYLIADDNKFLAIEMTCSESKYVGSSFGKRSKAQQQLYNTLEILFTNPVIRSSIGKRSVKKAIFSWKNTSNLNSIGDEAERGFSVFTDFSDSTYSPNNEQKFDFGFTFREIRYPDVLDWDSL